MNRPTAIILAGGASSRMGSCKALLPWRGSTMLGWIISRLRAGGCGEILIVTGMHHQEISAARDWDGARLVENATWERGMLSSIQEGLIHATTAALICLVDQPFLTADLVAQLIENEDHIRQPRFAGRARHPVFIPQRYFKEIIALPPSVTLRDFMHSRAAEIEYVETELSLNDLDTPEEYLAAVRLHPPPV